MAKKISTALLSRFDGIYFMRFTRTFLKKLPIFVCIFLSVRTFSQSYYYFEATVNTAENTPLPYYIFLTVDADGTAEARVLYKDPVTGSGMRVKQNFIDSAYSQTNSEDTIRFLVPVGSALGEDETEVTDYIQPRFVFKKQLSHNQAFYVPVRVEYSLDKQNWTPGGLTVNQQKTYAELTREKNFVSLFFGANESFYTYLFDIGRRGIALTKTEKKTKLFLIAVANTTDSVIGVSCAKDLNKVTETFTTMASQLGIKIITNKISGKGFNKKAVDMAINTLKPAAADIVVFYYSGHGFRFSNDVSKYPRISFRTNQQQDIGQYNMSVEDVYNRILQKGARINIVLSDCCNEDIGANSPVGKPPLKTREAGIAGLKLNIDNCRKLFFPNHPVAILATAAEKDQLSVGNPALGGFFTNFFYVQLIKSLYGNQGETSWLRLLLNAKESARWQALSAMCDKDRCVQRAEISVVPPQ